MEEQLQIITVRARESLVKKVDELVQNMMPKYGSRSHFIICAINELVQKEEMQNEKDRRNKRTNFSSDEEQKLGGNI